MNEELKMLEAELKGHAPAALDPSLLDRFEMAIQGELEQLEPELRVTEQMLGKQSPAKLPDALAGELVETVRRTPFPVDGKVLMFPGESSAKPATKSSRSWMAAAACVALAGALSAFFVGPKQDGPSLVSQPGKPATKVVNQAAERGAFVPASFNSGVRDTSDLGVVWPERSRPMRVVKVVYRDQVKLLNEQGEEVVVEVPRVEFLVVPEKID